MATGIPQGYGQYSLPTMGKGQKDIYNMLKGKFSSSGGDILEKLFGQAQGQGDAFSQLESQGRQGLQQELGNIGMQFGLSGANKSSGFNNAVSGAAQNFASDLYGKRADLMQKSMQDVLGLGNMLLGTQTDQFGLYQKENILRDLMQMLGNVGGQAAGTFGGIKLAGAMK